jgi:hypothetical protein
MIRGRGRGTVKSVDGRPVYLHPTIPNHVSLQRTRRRAAREGKCLCCRLRTREGDGTHCRVCLDRKYDRRRRLA